VYSLQVTNFMLSHFAVKDVLFLMRFSTFC